MQKELEFRRRKDEEIFSSDCGVVNNSQVEILTYNVCKKNLNFEDARMKKFLVPTVNISQGQSRIPPYPWDILVYVTQ